MYFIISCIYFFLSCPCVTSSVLTLLTLFGNPVVACRRFFIFQGFFCSLSIFLTVFVMLTDLHKIQLLLSLLYVKIASYLISYGSQMLLSSIKMQFHSINTISPLFNSIPFVSHSLCLVSLIYIRVDPPESSYLFLLPLLIYSKVNYS